MPAKQNGFPSRLIAGIDPGLYGAVATLDTQSGEMTVRDVPLFNLGTAKSKKMVIDEVGLGLIFDDMAKQGVSEAWLEKVGSRPGEGHVGAFNFGRTYGLLRGLCVAHFFVIHDAPPATWMAAMGVKNVKGRKDHSRARASQLMPTHAHNWLLVKHDGRAEAALIAQYGVLRGEIDRKKWALAA